MFYEFKHIGSSDYFVKEYGENFSFPPHMHLCIELVVALDGEMNVTVDGKENILHRGEALLIFPNQLHSLASEKSRHLLCIFSPDLVRAYSSSAAENLANAKIASMELCKELVLTVDYTGVDSVQKFLSTRTCPVLSSDYGAQVSLLVAVKKTETEELGFVTLDNMSEKAVCDKLRAVDINTLTPLEAINLIFELKKDLR